MTIATKNYSSNFSILGLGNIKTQKFPRDATKNANEDLQTLSLPMKVISSILICKNIDRYLKNDMESLTCSSFSSRSLFACEMYLFIQVFILSSFIYPFIFQ